MYILLFFVSSFAFAGEQSVLPPASSPLIGECVGDCKNGAGLFKFKNGDIYHGGWYNGLQSGTGRCIWSDGSKYSGDWYNGRPSGFGYFSSGDYSYSGNFENGKQSGKGMENLSDGTAYDGVYADGKRVVPVIAPPLITMEPAKGQPPNPTLAVPLIATCPGICDGNCNSGSGTMTYKNGDYYSGTWRNDLPTGTYGKYNWADGTMYLGTWINGQANGEGLLKKGNYSYSGNFINSKPSGNGSEKGIDGSDFDGTFQDGKRLKRLEKFVDKRSPAQVLADQQEYDKKEKESQAERAEWKAAADKKAADEAERFDYNRRVYLQSITPRGHSSDH